MNCLVLLVKKQLDKNGGSKIPSPFVLTRKQYTEQFPEIEKRKMFDIKNEDSEYIHELFHSDGELNGRLLSRLETVSHTELMDFISRYGNLTGKNGDTLAHKMVLRSHTFSTQEISELQNPINSYGDTLAHLSIRMKDETFSVEEILELGDPPDKNGNTLSHCMAYKGYKFSADDVIRLNNPINGDGDSLAECVLTFSWRKLKKKEIDELSNLDFSRLR